MKAPRAYYNEIDPAAVAILRQLITDDVILPGDVDTRSIKEVHADDLRGYVQCHFFAGGGLWSVAARMAGWPDDRSLWTGSCPCQPFSAAGKGRGTDDPRHLWPDFHRLIRAARPAVVMGEQVAGKAGYGWLDGVRADLANQGYASRGVDIPACAVDAPHQRNRLYWLAVEHTEGIGRREGRPEHELRGGWPALASADAPGGHNGRVADGNRSGPPSIRRDPGEVGGVQETQRRPEHDAALSWRGNGQAFRHLAGSRRNGSSWADAEWLQCHDGKARRTKPALRLLVDGLSGRVDLWRVGGNAIVPVEAAEVIAAFLDAEQDLMAAA